jgi:neutral ceramidase
MKQGLQRRKKMRNARIVAILAGALGLAITLPALAQQPPPAMRHAEKPMPVTQANSLRVGVAKVDITPTNLTNLNPMGGGTFAGVHDPIFARALIIDNGRNTAALVALDLIETGSTLQLRERIQRELAIPVDHLIITASHDHSSPRLGKVTPGALAHGGGAEVDTYTDTVNDKIVAAIRQAKASLQPARLGLATGSADVSVNRDLFTPQGWTMGFNPNGPSDKTVWVIKFEKPSGAPIAVLFNYAVHSTVTLGNQMVSGDLAGAAERNVEQHYGDEVVALWTLGPAGDQDPKFSWMSLNAPPPTGSMPAQNKEQRPSAFDVVDAEGFMVGAEVVRVANLIRPTTSSGQIEAEERVFSCPLKQGVNLMADMKQEQVSSVPIRLGLIMIDHIALATVSGEVVTNIYSHLKKASPLTNTIMITIANDRIGYIADDAAYDTPTHEVNGSPVARGCAENGIVNGLVDMINKRL